MMKRFIIGAMLILGLCSWVKAQKIDVRIRVVDEWNRPLQGVMMRIAGNADESFLSYTESYRGGDDGEAGQGQPSLRTGI